MPVPVTFVLPGDYRSGGVRVTVIMANKLLERGHRVRIACPRRRARGWSGLKQALNAWSIRANRNAGWLHQFRGDSLTYGRLDDLEYAHGEIVIAVGTYMVGEVRAMTKPVVKVRFNHGFPAKPDAAQDAAWRGRMPTITVSNTLVARLQEQTEGSVWGVVPNGIDTQDYHPDPTFPRDGIGAVYNPHPNKAPEDLLSVLDTLREKLPLIPQRIFSAEARPRGLDHAGYSRLPSVEKAREIYSRSKVWVLTSRTEGLPGVVLEAMACGCVVVSSDNDGSLEILQHEENGIIVSRGNRAGFVDAVQRVVTDDPLRERLAFAAMKSIQGFTWDRATDRMQAFLRAAPHLPS